MQHPIKYRLKHIHENPLQTNCRASACKKFSTLSRCPNDENRKYYQLRKVEFNTFYNTLIRFDRSFNIPNSEYKNKTSRRDKEINHENNKITYHSVLHFIFR